jgi:hypothetical protein
VSVAAPGCGRDTWGSQSVSSDSPDKPLESRLKPVNIGDSSTRARLKAEVQHSEDTSSLWKRVGCF